MKHFIKILLFLFSIQTSLLLHTQEPTTIFCHGILDTKKQIHRYKKFIPEPNITFDFPDAEQPSGYNFNNFIYQIYSMIRSQPCNRDKMYMGYGPDVQALKDQIQDNIPYILFGFSRGGITILNYLAENNPNNVRGVILNAVPSDLMQSVNNIQKAIGYTFAATRIEQENLFNMIFPQYKIGSTPPKDIIPLIKNKHLPIFIVHAKTDTVVPISSSWELYVSFLQEGFTNIHLCELESGQHKAYHQSPDKLCFLQNLHSFYKKHSFGYNPEFAIIDNLNNLQPNINEITQKLNL